MCRLTPGVSAGRSSRLGASPNHEVAVPSKRARSVRLSTFNLQPSTPSSTPSSAPTFYMQQLGCPKNLVDGENMAQLLREAGYVEVDDPGEATALIVNTCGFIKAAEQESLDALDALAKRKRRGQQLIATGCLAQRWGDRLPAAVPGIDGDRKSVV